jgi:hypothetical protein
MEDEPPGELPRFLSPERMHLPRPPSGMNLLEGELRRAECHPSSCHAPLTIGGGIEPFCHLSA